MFKKITLFSILFALVLVTKTNAMEIISSGVNIPLENDFVDVKPGDWYFEAAKYSKSQGIFQGNEKNEFSPKSNITRAEMAQILFNIKRIY